MEWRWRLRESDCSIIKEKIFILPGVELTVKEGANGIHTLIVFNCYKNAINEKKPRGYFFAFTNIPLSFLIPLSMDVVTSRMVIITSCALS